MKMRQSVLFLCFSIFLYDSCQQEEELSSMVVENVPVEKVSNVILDGIGVQDTLKFQYDREKVSNVQWCTQLSNVCVTGDSELRFYDAGGQLDSINGRWQISYSYKNHLRKKIIAFKDGAYYSTTTFLKFSGTYPTRIKVEFATSEVRYVDLEFDASGDLVHKTVKDNRGLVLENIQISYSAIENPLRSLMETPSYAVLFFGFDDFIFYYSNHVPETIINSSTSIPGYNYNPHRIIRYELELDDSGRLHLAQAFIEEFDINIHNVVIRYL